MPRPVGAESRSAGPTTLAEWRTSTAYNCEDKLGDLDWGAMQARGTVGRSGKCAFGHTNGVMRTLTIL
jgi:hypothetical protein